ncbi:MAG TPA: hypothetical protein VF676_00030 [Flavobacterium sp.]
MKKIKLLLIAVIVFVFSGCDDNGPSASLRGTWNLVKTVGGISGETTTFETGLVTWNFDTPSHTVTIMNNNTDENAYDVFESGTYDYSFEENTTNDFCEQTLVIDNTDLGCHTLSSDQLIITQPEADGYVLTLVR